jgi:antitoxin HigA-1
MRPVHPGKILREEYLAPLKLTAHALSKLLHVPPARINEIVREERGVTPDTALRLARFFGGDAQSWMNLQVAYDLKVTEKEVAGSRKKSQLASSWPLRINGSRSRPDSRPHIDQVMPRWLVKPPPPSSHSRTPGCRSLRVRGHSRCPSRRRKAGEDRSGRHR